MRSALIAAALALSGAASAAWAAPEQPATPQPPVPARYESCAGWGLCTFRLLPPAAAARPVLPVPPAPPAPPVPPVPLAAPVQAAGERVRVRLRGVGDPALSGTCAPEREAARTIRRFVEGILARATRIELVRIEPRSDGSALATVRADGTDVVEILVHIGLGRERPLPPDATWCD